MTSSTVPLRNLSSDAAHAAVAAAVAHARGLGIRVNAAAVDASGVLLAFLRMDGAFLHSGGIAIDKAYTAASFGFPTEGWGPVLEGDATLKAGLPAVPRLVVFGGGVPAYEGAQRVGALGVSGGSAEQDAACARAGLAAIGLAEQAQ
eukprot:Opistho-1_new@29139